MLVTQFEVADARRMFPGWDEPAFKATFQLSVTLPASLAAVSNMPMAASTPAAGGMQHVIFATTPRMSTYLLALIAGDMRPYATAPPTPIMAVWAPTGEQEQARYALDVEHQVLPFYNAYFGVPYPLPKLDLIAIPGNYAGGCDGELGRDHLHRRRAAVRSRDVVAAHARDDLPRCRARDGAPMVGRPRDHGLVGQHLAERGFRHLDGAQGDRPFQPDWEIWPRQHEAREEAMAQDALPTTHPIQQVIRDESEAHTAFDRISYQKGEQVIRMIEDWIGADDFRDGMRAYMKAHQYGNATSADLWAALAQASGKDVAQAWRADSPNSPACRWCMSRGAA